MTPTQIELHNAHKARLQRIEQAAARINPKTDKQLYAALNAVQEKPAETEPPKPEQSHDQWARDQINRNTQEWSKVISNITTTSDGQPTIRTIQLATCDVYRVKINDLLSARRTANVTVPRHVSMYLTKEITGLSYPQIGRGTGMRDHTVAIYAFRKIERLLEDGDEMLRSSIEQIKKLIGVQA